MTTFNQDLTVFIDAVHAFLNDLHDERLKSYIADWPAADVTFRPTAPCSLPVLTYMNQAFRTASEKTEGIVNMLASMADRIAWGQTYSAEDFNAGFLEKYGWTEFIGQRGPLPSKRVACGVLMLGPEIEYPRHRHEAEEVYIPLTGQTLWLQGDQDWTFREIGRPIYHAPWVTHAMKTGPSPLLALYLWRAGNLTQKSIIES
ncbi:MAG: dimethylsulfonioproprionate lyase family protein [Thermodesulfobacteriota bacterium]